MPRALYIQFIGNVPQERIQRYLHELDSKAITKETENSYSVLLQKNTASASIADLTKAHFPRDEYVLCTGQIIHRNKPLPSPSAL